MTKTLEDLKNEIAAINATATIHFSAKHNVTTGAIGLATLYSANTLGETRAQAEWPVFVGNVVTDNAARDILRMAKLSHRAGR